MPKKNGLPTMRELLERHANEMCSKANEIFRLEQRIEELTHAAEDATRYQFAQAKEDCQFCVCMWDDKLAKWLPFRSKEASDYYIDRAMKEQP